MSEKEIEIDLDAKVVPTQQAYQNGKIRVDETESVNQDIVKFGKNMNDDEFIHALAEAPDEMLIPWEEVPLQSNGIYYNGWTNGVV